MEAEDSHPNKDVLPSSFMWVTSLTWKGGQQFRRKHYTVIFGNVYHTFSQNGYLAIYSDIYTAGNNRWILKQFQDS